MQNEVKGLVIRSVNIGEADRLITVFTREAGTVSALVRGARSLKNRNMSACQPFCYSSFVFNKRGDKLYVKEATAIESFFGIRNSLVRLSLANYILEVLCDITVAYPEEDLLRLALNSLYALSEGKYSEVKIKAAFETRAMAIIGFMPDILACRECGERTGEFFFDIMSGNIQCYACRDRAVKQRRDIDESGEARIVTILSEGAKFALAFCTHCPLERLFSFSISDEDEALLSRAAEEYVLNQLERGFKSLDFYKEVMRL